MSRAESARQNIGKAHEVIRKPKLILTCEHCHEPFEVPPSANKRRFCSRVCAYAFMRGSDGAGAISNRHVPIAPWNKGTGSSHAHHRTSGELIDATERWRNAVYRRDGFTCQDCHDNRGGNLNAHHIKRWADYPALRYEVSNGLTLCIECHKKRHAGRATCALCGRENRGHNLCRKHYLRWKKYGDPLLTKVKRGGAFILVRVEQ